MFSRPAGAASGSKCVGPTTLASPGPARVSLWPLVRPLCESRQAMSFQIQRGTVTPMPQGRHWKKEGVAGPKASRQHSPSAQAPEAACWASCSALHAHQPQPCPPMAPALQFGLTLGWMIPRRWASWALQDGKQHSSCTSWKPIAPPVGTTENVSKHCQTAAGAQAHPV